MDRKKARKTIEFLCTSPQFDALSDTQLWAVIDLLNGLPVKQLPSNLKATPFRGILGEDQVVVYDPDIISRRDALSVARGTSTSRFAFTMATDTYEAMFGSYEGHDQRIVMGIKCRRLSPQAGIQRIAIQGKPCEEMDDVFIRAVMETFGLTGNACLNKVEQGTMGETTHILVVEQGQGPIVKLLNSRQLEFLNLRTEDLTLSQIAERFGISAEAVRLQLNLAVRAIKKHGLASVLPAGYQARHSEEEILLACAGRQRKKKKENIHEQTD